MNTSMQKKHRRPAIKTRKIGQLVTARLFLHNRNHAESPNGARSVSNCVIRDRRKALARMREEANQDVTGMSDGGVSEQAFDTRLRQCRQVAQQH